MRKLLRYMKDYKLECVLGPLFKLLEALFDLIVPLVMAKMIDEGITTGSNDVIIKCALLLFLLAIIGLTCSITAQYFAAKAAIGFTSKIRSELFKHIQKLSVSQIDEVSPSTLITRMINDINQLQSGVNMALRLFLRSPFIVFGAVIMSFTIDAKEGLIFSVMIPLLAIVIFSVMLLTMPIYKKIQGRLDMLTGHTDENLKGARVIRAFRREENFVEKFEDDNEKLRNLQLTVGRISNLMNPLTYLILNVFLVVIVWSGAVRLNVGGIMAGQVIALINYMGQILVELIKLADTIILCTKAVTCGQRIQAVFEIEPEFGYEDEALESSKDGKKSDAPLLEFRNVDYRYKKAKENSLDKISFSISAGESIGIIGVTGSGKSTLVNLIPRFYDVSNGEIYYRGVDIRNYPLKSLRDKVSICLQKSVLLSGTVKDNMYLSNPNATDEEIEAALKASDSYSFLSLKRGYLNFKISEGGSNLSGGQKQRVSIARALVRNPEILILDDSFSALDFKTEKQVRSNILSSRKDAVTIIVSQRISSISDCDRIIVMEEGEIDGIGSHEYLLENSEVYKEIYDTQQQSNAVS